MTAIESKEEISDTDSGIILNSGKDCTGTKQMSSQVSASFIFADFILLLTTKSIMEFEAHSYINIWEMK